MVPNESPAELLFSYGTLQLLDVQMATFGRLLAGSRDTLPRFALEPLKIEDAGVIAISGQAEHTIAKFTGHDDDVIPGLVFELTAEDIRRADNYEVADCKRVALILGSGRRAWVYVDPQALP
jgi:hypothetical protein